MLLFLWKQNQNKTKPTNNEQKEQKTKPNPNTFEFYSQFLIWLIQSIWPLLSYSER